MEKNLEIIQKLYDFEKQMYGYLKKYPKDEKFALVSETKNTIYSISKKLVKSAKLEKKKAMLYETDAELFHLKHLVRLAYDLKYLSPKAYEVSAKKLAEIGRMLGGWIKTVQSKK